MLRQLETRKFYRTSLLRLLPAVFVALIPFTVFDDALLCTQYRLRGSMEPQADTRVVLASSSDRVPRLLDALKQLGSPRCLIITRAPLTGGSCELFNVEGLFSRDALEVAALQIPPGPASGYRGRNSTLFYGPLRVFKPLDADVALSTGKQALANARTVVIVDMSSNPEIPILTPIGGLTLNELALNVALNRIEGLGFQRIARWGEILVAASLGITTAWLLYSYPIMLTLIFTLILGTVAFAIAMMLFDSAGIQLPLASSWASMLTVCLLGMGDRLDRRERREWAVEREAEHLKTVDEMRNNFLSLVSHDLKTPIAKLLSVLDRFTRGEFGAVTELQKSMLERMVSTSGYLQRTISTLLLLGRIESRDFRIHRGPTDIVQLLEEAVQQNHGLAHERGILLEKDLEPLFLIDIDRDLILQVACNLIDNALKYSPPNSRVQIRSGEMENCPELSPPQPGVWFEVQDAGPGIPRGDRRKVLQKFVRGSSESTAADQSVKGTGLGLYLAQFFVEKHGGNLTLVSKTPDEEPRPDEAAESYFSGQKSGTVVRIVLPIDPPLI